MMNPSEDTFLEGKVVEIHKKDAIISINQLEHRVQLEDCLKLTYGAIDVADMVDLE